MNITGSSFNSNKKKINDFINLILSDQILLYHIMLFAPLNTSQFFDVILVQSKEE